MRGALAGLKIKRVCAKPRGAIFGTRSAGTSFRPYVKTLFLVRSKLML